MSTSIIKKALQLFNEDDSHEKCLKGTQKKVKRTKRPRHSTGSSKLKSSNSTWLTVADIRGRLRSNDRTDDNLRALKLLDSTRIDPDTASKIMLRACGKRSEEKVEMSDGKTAFTEEDFEKFEKEYFLSD